MPLIAAFVFFFFKIPVIYSEARRVCTCHSFLHSIAWVGEGDISQSLLGTHCMGCGGEMRMVMTMAREGFDGSNRWEGFSMWRV